MHALSCSSAPLARQCGGQDRAQYLQFAGESCQGLADHLDLHIALMHPVITVMGVAGAGMAALRMRIEIDAGDDETLRAKCCSRQSSCAKVRYSSSEAVSVR